MKVTNKLFRKLNIYTIIAVYFLILVGGIVRSTGSGMGCPDWPKCFGSLVPPTNESQLPNGYQDYYLSLRLKKNQRIANMINSLGFSSLANKITNDPSILVEEPFNATKTWIEYINRLIGVFIGLFIIAVFIASIFRYKEHPSLFYWSLFSVILVGFQGWFGSIVVSTNLLPGTISVHMGLALLQVCILLFMAFKSYSLSQEVKIDTTGLTMLSNLILLAMLIFVLQIFIGTQVREAIDHIADKISNRNQWIENLSINFYIHRSYSLLIFALQSFMAFRLYKLGLRNRLLTNLFYGLVGLIALEIFTGVIMAYFGVPALFQPLHLVVATLIFGLQFYAYLNLNYLKKLNHKLI